MIAFITGSHAYGIPSEESDLDLVIAINNEWEEDLIQKIAAGVEGSYRTCRYGKLNLIIFDFSDPKEIERYHRWKRVHDILVAKRPVTREEAVALHKEYKTSRWD